MKKGGESGERGTEGGREGREGGSERGRDGRRVGLTEGRREVRREGTRAKPGNQLVYCICIHLLDPRWNMPRQAVISTQQHKLFH